MVVLAKGGSCQISDIGTALMCGVVVAHGTVEDGVFFFHTRRLLSVIRLIYTSIKEGERERAYLPLISAWVIGRCVAGLI